MVLGVWICTPATITELKVAVHYRPKEKIDASDNHI
jgi:hypothetical protein